MKLRRLTISLAVSAVCLVGLTGSAVAAASSKTGQSKTASAPSSAGAAKSSSATGAAASNTAQGYAAASPLQIGTIVQLVPKNSHGVEPASAANLTQMYGVVVDPHSLPVTVSNTSIANETYVATSGTYDVLVSAQNGVIEQGDYVTVSSVDGVAMKADISQKTVFGRATAGFDGKNNILGNVTLKTTTGAVNKTVTIGVVPVSIDIENNPDIKTTKANLPPVLQKIGLAIADKPISPLRMYLSIAITISCLAISVTVLYAGVRSGIMSLGRNPLSRGSIIRGLISIILTSFLIVIIGLFAVYLLLKL